MEMHEERARVFPQVVASPFALCALRRRRRAMKRSAPDENEEEEEALAKRTRSDTVTARSSNEFERRKREPAFRTAHHPEWSAHRLVEQRNLAKSALPLFLLELKNGVLPGPRRTTTFPPPTDSEPSSAVCIDPLPAGVAAFAFPQMLAAAAGAAADASGGEAEQSDACRLQALLFAEPLSCKTR
eukprot:2022401-Prymnesium_polylepis.1